MLRTMPSLESPKVSHLVVACVLLVFFLLNATSILYKTPTYDEFWHLEYGNKILKGDPSREGDLRWETKMPFSAMNALVHFAGARDEEVSEVEPDPLLKIRVATRLVTTVFAMALALIVFSWARGLYGIHAGFFALILYALCPNIIAHSRLATTDLYSALATTAALYAFWAFVNHGGLARASLSAVTLGVSQLAKYTCVLLFPLFLLILAVKFLPELRKLDLRSLSTKLGHFLLMTAFFILVSILVINVGFGFHETNIPFGEQEFRSDLFRGVQEGLPFLDEVPVPLPRAFLQGLDLGRYHERTGRSFGSVYLLGELRPHEGFFGYYAVASLFKVPLPAQIFFLTALVSYAVRRRGSRFWKHEVFLLVPITFFIVYFNVFFRAQIGIRHLLIYFPLVFIFCGSLVEPWATFTARTKGLVAGLLLLQTASVLSYHPHYLSYFNELVWDRSGSYRILADSNIDWGQNQWYLQEYLERHEGARFAPRRPTGGRVIVSVNMLTGVLEPRRYRWLRENFEPAGHIAYSYLIFDVDPEELSRIAPDR